MQIALSCLQYTELFSSLIMSMIVADLMKSGNFIAFQIIGFLHDPIITTDPYCQASGFMVQFGTEVTGQHPACSQCHYQIVLISEQILLFSSSLFIWRCRS